MHLAQIRKMIFAILIFATVVFLVLIPKEEPVDTGEPKTKIEETEINEEEEVEEEEHSNDDNDGERDIFGVNLNTMELVANNKLKEFDFIGANNYLAEELKKYNSKDSSEYNEYISTYTEIALMANFPEMKARGELRSIRDAIHSLKNSDNFLLSVMWLDNSERLYFIKSTDSLNPIFEGGLGIKNKKNVEIGDTPELKNAEIKIGSIKEVIEHEISVEENELIAYVIRDNDEKLHLYKIIEKTEGSTYYLTIAEWDKLNREIEKNLNNNKGIKNENITEEEGGFNESK